jgi:alkanesulfonate monooxygenase SsuD/methylene tetrahydromethanopterin reductase-like flavin-dependent oxidoreductase (luciferase family)
VTHLGRVGLWSTELRGAARAEVRDAVAELNALGWNTPWLPGLAGSGALEALGHLLAAAPDSRVVTGVLNIRGRSAVRLSARIGELDGTYGPRSVIGLGIGSPAGAAAHGREYGSPVTTMSRYLDELGFGEDDLVRAAATG